MQATPQPISYCWEGGLQYEPREGNEPGNRNTHTHNLINLIGEVERSYFFPLLCLRAIRS